MSRGVRVGGWIREFMHGVLGVEKDLSVPRKGKNTGAGRRKGGKDRRGVSAFG